MAWTSRFGLNIVPTSTTITDSDLNQNIKARMALGRFVAESLTDGEGIYSGGASVIGDITSGTDYPAFSLVIYDDSHNPFFFKKTTITTINFDISSGNGILYAIIKSEPLISPSMAIAGIDDVDFYVYDESQSAPLNSIRLGFGVVASSALTSYTTYDESFTALSLSAYFYLKGNSGITRIVNSKNSVRFAGSDGISISNPSDLQFDIDANLYASGGIEELAGGLALKLSPSGGLAKDSDGLYVDTIAAAQFTLSGDSGVDQTITTGNTLSILGSGAIATSINTDKEISITLNLHSESGLQEINDQLGIKLKADSGLSLSTAGIEKIDSVFYLSADVGSNKTLQSAGTLRIFGQDSITSGRTTGNTIDVSLVLDSNPGLEQDAAGLKLKLKDGGGLELNANGLIDTEYYINNTKYGHPNDEYHEVGDYHRDKSGSLWYCEESGIPGIWTQLDVGNSLEGSESAGYELPISTDFYGNFIPPGYKIRWSYINNTSSYVSYANSFIWSWRLENVENNIGYWISEDISRVKFKKDNEANVASVNTLVPLSNDGNTGTNYFKYVVDNDYSANTKLYYNYQSFLDGTFLMNYGVIDWFGRACLDNYYMLDLDNNFSHTSIDTDKFDGFYIENIYAYAQTEIYNKFTAISSDRTWTIKFYIKDDSSSNNLISDYNITENEIDEFNISNIAMKFNSSTRPIILAKVEPPFIFGDASIIANDGSEHSVSNTSGNPYLEVADYADLDDLATAIGSITFDFDLDEYCVMYLQIVADVRFLIDKEDKLT